jgi:hypothetical protein
MSAAAAVAASNGKRKKEKNISGRRRNGRASRTKITGRMGARRKFHNLSLTDILRGKTDLQIYKSRTNISRFRIRLFPALKFDNLVNHACPMFGLPFADLQKERKGRQSFGAVQPSGNLSITKRHKSCSLKLGCWSGKAIQTDFFQDWSQVSKKLSKSTFSKFQQYLRQMIFNMALVSFLGFSLYDYSNTVKDF